MEFRQLTPEGLLSVSYKNTTLLTNFQATFTPSPGRLIFAGRTGGSYQEQDVDNIRIVTVAPTAPVISPSIGNANGFKFAILDQSTFTPATNSITLTLDGVTVSPTSLTQSGNIGSGAFDGVTTVAYQNTGLLLLPGSTHTNTVRFTGPGFNPVDQTNVFTVPAYTFLTLSQKSPGTVNTALGGFAGRIHQLPVARFPSATDLIGIERQLADGFVDPGTSQPYVSIALTNAFTNAVINWSQDQPAGGGPAGIFNVSAAPPADYADDPIPGVDANFQPNTDNVAAEVITILDLPVGAYELGVNHDDGFKLSVGAEPRDAFKALVLASNTSAADNTGIRFAVTNAGKYPFRLAWGEAAGGAQLEFYLVNFNTGQKVLINNRTNPVQVSAYRDLAALTQPYVRWVHPAPGETGVPPGEAVVAKLEDGTAGTIVGSPSLTVNGGGSDSVVKVGLETTITVTNWPLPAGSLSTAQLVYSTTLGGPFTNTWVFGVSYYGQVLFNFPLNEGSGNVVTDTALGLSGGSITSPIWTNDTPTGAAGDFALRFDGNGTRRISIPDPTKLVTLGRDITGTNGDYTAECWVKLPLGFEPTARMILFLYEGGIPAFSFSINGNTDGNPTTRRTLHTTTFGLNDVNSAAVVPNDNQWHHVAVVHENGVRMLFYIDGVLKSGVPYTRGPGTRTTFEVNLGAASGGANAFTGFLDRVRFSKGALKPNQFDLLTAPPAPDTMPGNITSALALHLKLDELAGLTAVDSSGNGRHAAMIGFPDSSSHWVPGRFGGGAQFNVSGTGQHGAIDDTSGGLNLTNTAFTLAAWVKAAPLNQSNGGGIIAKGTGGSAEQYTLDITTGGVLRFLVRNSTGATTTFSTLGNNTNTINDSWLHIVAVCDVPNPAAGMKLYLNGLLAIQANAPATLLDSLHEVSVGARESSASSGYDLSVNGLIDDVRIYKRALTARDAATLYAEADALRLALQLSGTAGTLSWPSWGSNAVPQSATNVMPAGTIWTDLGGTATPDGYFLTQPVTIQPGNRFFRLRPGP